MSLLWSRAHRPVSQFLIPAGTSWTVQQWHCSSEDVGQSSSLLSLAGTGCTMPLLLSSCKHPSPSSEHNSPASAEIVTTRFGPMAFAGQSLTVTHKASCCATVSLVSYQLCWLEGCTRMPAQDFWNPKKQICLVFNVWTCPHMTWEQPEMPLLYWVQHSCLV